MYVFVELVDICVCISLAGTVAVLHL